MTTRRSEPPQLVLALLTAALAGLLLDLAFPATDLWPLAFPAIGLALLSLQGRSAGGAALTGFVFGIAFFLPHVEWTTLFLGPLPWLALSTVMALWSALGGVAIALAYRWLPRTFSGPWGELFLIPAVVAGLWMLREDISATWPYGGFSWGRASFSQSDSPLSSLFAWLGASGVTFVMVFVVAAAIAAVRTLRARPAVGSFDRWTAPTALVVVTVVLLALPAWPVPYDGSLRVGAVQGNTKSGYFDPPERRGDNLVAQFEATRPIFDSQLDLVVWPEGASDLDPTVDVAAAELWEEVARRAGAPLLGWAVTTRDERQFNSSMLWRERQGVVDYYDKKHLVPFGEYVPDRAFWRQFAPDLIDQVRRELTPGTAEPTIDVGRPTSSIIAGLLICFEIVDDALATELVEAGARLVIAPSNNADFGRTDQSLQQLAIARIRAIELGRAVVNISTVGTSAIIYPDGTIEQQLPSHQSGVLISDVPLSSVVTPAVAVGKQATAAISITALLILVVGGGAALRDGVSSRGRSANRRREACDKYRRRLCQTNI